LRAPLTDRKDAAAAFLKQRDKFFQDKKQKKEKKT
jgi:hypothetical protein